MNNVSRFHLITFLLNLSFTLPIWVIFGTDYLGLTHLQAYWLGTFYWLVSAVFEIPTGSWADRFGRKRIYSYGILMGIMTLILFVLTKNFYILVISQIAAGIAVALKSGPLTSLVYDWLKAQDRENEFLNISSNNLTYLFIGRIVGGALGGIAYTIYPTLPYLLLIGAEVIALIVVQGLTESRHVTKDPLFDKAVIRDSIHTFLQLMKKNDFAIVMYSSIAFMSFSNMLYFSYQPYFQKLGFTGSSIGLLYIPLSLASAFGSQVIKKIIPKIATPWLYVIMLGTTAAVGMAMNTMNIWVGMIAIMCLGIIFGFDIPATEAFFQRFYPSKIRATMSSIESLVGSIVLLLASITTGYFIDQYSLNSLFIFVLSVTFVVTFVAVIASLKSIKRMDDTQALSQ